MATAKFYPVFYQRLTRAFKSTVDDVDAAFTAVIESSIFPWPGVTRRRNGTVVGSPRDIVDTGAFRDSQSYSYPSAMMARFLWDIEYAAIILYGATLSNGGIIPGRDWIAETQRQVNFEEVFADNCKRVFT